MSIVNKVKDILKGIIPSWRELSQVEGNYPKLKGIIPSWRELSQVEGNYPKLKDWFIRSICTYVLRTIFHYHHFLSLSLYYDYNKMSIFGSKLGHAVVMMIYRTRTEIQAWAFGIRGSRKGLRYESLCQMLLMLIINPWLEDGNA
jgi:hypothetical protein